jgi:hypothetical protein
LLFCSEGITLTKFQAQIPFQLSIVFPALWDANNTKK